MSIAKSCLVIETVKLEKLHLDGPALKITMKAQCSRLFPLRRLSRIHIIGSVDQCFEPLVYCAEHQIPVAFFSVKGKLRCQLYYPIYENGIISHWLDHVDFDCDAKNEYEEWLYHQKLNVLSKLGVTNMDRENRFQYVDEHLNHQCQKILGKEKFKLALEWLTGIMTVHCSQLIVNEGVGNESRSKRRLLEDMLPILTLYLKFYLYKSSSKNNFSVNGNTMSQLYQHYNEHIEYAVRKMIVQLSSRLESIV